MTNICLKIFISNSEVYTNILFLTKIYIFIDIKSLHLNYKQ